MIETDFTLPTGDGKTIYGRVNAPAQNADKSLILVHGLTGHMHEQQLLRTAYHFAARGYEVYRFNLYGDEQDARKIGDTSLRTHADDLNTVIDYVKSKEGEKPLCVAGHSYGGMTMLVCNPQDIRAFVFWDSCLVPAAIWNKEAISKVDGGCVVDWGVSINIGETMYREGLRMTVDHTLPLAHNITTPSLVINADESLKNSEYQGLYEALNCPKRHVIVANADHCFTRLGNLDAALIAMQDWFEAHP